MSRVVALIVGLWFVVFGVGCEQAPAKVVPDPRIDQAAFALVPVRATYAKPAKPLTDETARTIENALRVEYAPVECRGPHARVSMNLLQGASRKSPELVRRDGRSIYVLEGGVDPVGYKDCSVVGSYLAGPATMLKAFARPPASTEEFTFQQSLWLAIREPWGLDAGALSASFYTFLAENLGAQPPEDRTSASLDVIALDRSFNPCTKDSKKATGDNQVFFKCLAGVSYANTIGFAPYRDKILGFIAKAERDYLQRLATASSDDGPEAQGMAVALGATAKPGSLSVAAGASLPPVLAPPAELADTIASPDPSPNLAILGVAQARLVVLLGLRLGNTVADVFSEMNPRTATTPPSIAATAADASIGTADANGWRRLGDAFVALRGDSFVTARAVSTSGGARFRARAWQVVGTSYWTSDQGRSAWQYSDARKQFLRSSFNGNPFDANAGKLASARVAAAGPITTKSDPMPSLGTSVTAASGPSLPTGWTERSDGALVDPKDQAWSWNSELGGFVKDQSSTGPPVAGVRTGGDPPPNADTSAGAQSVPSAGGALDPQSAAPVTPIGAFRSDYGLEGSAAAQRALVNTPGDTEYYGSVAQALPYGHDNTSNGGANDSWRPNNQCGDIAVNASKDLNALGINAGSVAVTAGDGSQGHAVVWMQDGTTQSGTPTFAYFDPQSGTYVDNGGQGYTDLNQGVHDLGTGTGTTYASMGHGDQPGQTTDWRLENDVAGGAVHTSDSPPYAGFYDHPSDGTHSSVAGAGQGSFGWYDSSLGDSPDGADRTSEPAPSGPYTGPTPTPALPSPDGPGAPAGPVTSAPAGEDPTEAPSTPPDAKSDDQPPSDTSPPPPEDPAPSEPDTSDRPDPGGGSTDFSGNDFGDATFGGDDFG